MLEALAAPTTSVVPTGGVAWWAHVGGFAFGIVLAPFFGRRAVSEQAR